MAHQDKQIHPNDKYLYQSDFNLNKTRFAQNYNGFPSAGAEIPLGFDPELCHRALSVYSQLRTLSKFLRLSPFTPYAFLRGLILKVNNPIMSEIHFSLLRFLGAYFVRIDPFIYSCPSPDWKYLDTVTWPYYFRDLVRIIRKKEKDELRRLAGNVDEDEEEETLEELVRFHPQLLVAEDMAVMEAHLLPTDAKLVVLEWLCNLLLDTPHVCNEVGRRMADCTREKYKRKLEGKLEEPHLTAALTRAVVPDRALPVSGSNTCGFSLGGSLRGSKNEAKDLFDLDGRLLQVLGTAESCTLCQDLGGGGLIQCGSCKLSFHHTCVKTQPSQAKDWECPECLIPDPAKGQARMGIVKTGIEGYGYISVIHGYVFRVLKKHGIVVLLTPQQVADMLMKLGPEKCEEWPYNTIYHTPDLFDFHPSFEQQNEEVTAEEQLPLAESIPPEKGSPSYHEPANDEMFPLEEEHRGEQFAYPPGHYPCQSLRCDTPACFGYTTDVNEPTHCEQHRFEGMHFFQLNTAEPKQFSTSEGHAQPGNSQVQNTVPMDEEEEEDEEDEDDEEEDGVKENKATPTPFPDPHPAPAPIRKQVPKGLEKLHKMPLGHNPLAYVNRYAEGFCRSELPQLELAPCSLKRYPLFRMFYIPKEPEADLTEAEQKNQVCHLDAIVQLFQNIYKQLQGLLCKTASPPHQPGH